jgi:AraC family transcriptional regulator
MRCKAGDPSQCAQTDVVRAVLVDMGEHPVELCPGAAVIEWRGNNHENQSNLMALVKCSDVGQILRLVRPKNRTSKGGILLGSGIRGSLAMNQTGVLPVRAVEVMQNGCPLCPFPTLSSLSSAHAGWDGIAMESFTDVPAVSIPEHDHPTHFINLLTHGKLTAQWTMGGKTQTAENGPGTIYLLPAGTRDRLTWSAPSSRIVLVMEPRFLARSLEDTAHLNDVELIMHWNLHDRHIQSLILALHADLEDGSPAGPLFGESLAITLGHYLIRRHSVRTGAALARATAMPTARLNRVLDFINQNCARDLRLRELAEVAGLSSNYFCEQFKESTGMTAYQYVLQRRIERAKHYLRDPKFTVASAGAATGFVNHSHFTKVFRRLVGVTPAQFRAAA